MISQADGLQSRPLVTMHFPFACVLSSLARWESLPSSSWAHIVHCRPERTRRPSSHEAIPPGSPKRLMVGFSSGQLRLWAELNHIEEKGCLSGKIVLFSSYMLLALKSWRRCLIVEVQSLLPNEPLNNLFDYMWLLWEPDVYKKCPLFFVYLFLKYRAQRERLRSLLERMICFMCILYW